MYRILYSHQAAKGIPRLKSASLDKKAKELVEIVRADPFAYPPAFEALPGDLAGYYSRRINRQHRFVYQVIAAPCEGAGETYEGTVKILRLWTHYEK